MLDSGGGLDNLHDLRADGSLASSVEYRRSPIMDVNLKTKKNISYSHSLVVKLITIYSHVKSL